MAASSPGGARNVLPDGVLVHRKPALPSLTGSTCKARTHACNTHTELGLGTSLDCRPARDRLGGQHESVAWLQQTPLHRANARSGRAQFLASRSGATAA